MAFKMISNKYALNDDGTITSFNYKRQKIHRNISFPTNPYGYKTCCIKIDGVEKTRLVHRMVAKAFIPNPHNKPEVNHIDTDKTNNHVSNLEWSTSKENMNHAAENNLTSKTKDRRQVMCIETGEIYDSAAEAGRVYCVSTSAILNSIKRSGKCCEKHWKKV